MDSEQNPLPADNPATEEKSSESENDGWINLTVDGGIKKKILVEGPPDAPTPPDGAEVICHYTGTLTSDGSQFDSSRDRGDPFTFELGKGRVIKCWDQGMKTLKKGERAILRCTSDYGYGDSGSPPKIPGGAGLDFDVEMIDFTTMVKVEKGIYKQVIQEGTGGWKKPNSEATVTFNFTSRLSEEDEKTTFETGENIVWDMEDEEKKYPEGFFICIKNMKKGEKTLFKVPPELAFGSEGNENVPPNSIVFYEIELLDFVNVKQAYECNSKSEKLDLAEAHRLRGNEFFKAARFEKAKKRYGNAETILKGLANEGSGEYSSDDSDDEEMKRVPEESATTPEEQELKERADLLRVAVNNNLAMVEIKLENFANAIEKANEVLKIDERNIKAMTRRGHAKMLMGDYKEGKDDLAAALEQEPENKYIGQLLTRCKKKIKQYKKKQKKLYGNMFG